MSSVVGDRARRVRHAMGGADGSAAPTRSPSRVVVAEREISVPTDGGTRAVFVAQARPPCDSPARGRRARQSASPAPNRSGTSCAASSSCQGAARGCPRADAERGTLRRRDRGGRGGRRGEDVSATRPGSCAAPPGPRMIETHEASRQARRASRRARAGETLAMASRGGGVPRARSRRHPNSSASRDPTRDRKRRPAPHRRRGAASQTLRRA